MAKESIKAREIKRAQMAEKFEAKRIGQTDNERT